LSHRVGTTVPFHCIGTRVW